MKAGRKRGSGENELLKKKEAKKNAAKFEQTEREVNRKRKKKNTLKQERVELLESNEAK